MMTMVAVGIGSTLGAVTRYCITRWATKQFGTGFPYGTFLINATGSFALALFMTLAQGIFLPAGWLLFVSPGFFSGLTTFSTFSYETVSLLNQGSYPAALLNLLGSLVMGLIGAGAGIAFATVLLEQL